MFENGSTLPVGSSSSSSSSYYYHYESSFSSSWSSSTSGSDADTHPTNSHSKEDDHNDMLSVDDLLHTFFHADHVSTLFNQVQSETRKAAQQAIQEGDHQEDCADAAQDD